MRKKLPVIGHRGVAAICPENTLPSFRRAIELGVDAVEFDVHFTRDKVMVIHHDVTVDRCSNGTGAVKDLTLAELKALDFGAKKSPEFAGTRIPTLSETLDTIYGLNEDMYLLVELKADDAECTRAAFTEIKRRGKLDQTLFLSFLPEQLRLLRELEPGLKLQGFPDRYLKAPPPAGTYENYDKICIWLSELTAEEIDFFHRQGIEVDTYAVDTTEALEKALAHDVDSITTNAAHLILPWLREKGLH